MVGLVIVSHSAALAGGVVELARQMGGEDVTIEAAGGMADPEGAIGTDAMLVHAAIERALGPDGVLVLMDLGSAVMSAEMAVEMIGAEHDDAQVVPARRRSSRARSRPPRAPGRARRWTRSPPRRARRWG